MGPSALRAAAEMKEYSIIQTVMLELNDYELVVEMFFTWSKGLRSTVGPATYLRHEFHASDVSK